MTVALLVPGASSAATTVYRFSVPPGQSTLVVATGEQAPLTNVRFFLGGSQEVRIVEVVGNVGFTPEIDFGGWAAPRDVTRFFAQVPIVSSPSSSFNLVVNNPTDEEQRLTVVVVYD